MSDVPEARAEVKATQPAPTAAGRPRSRRRMLGYWAILVGALLVAAEVCSRVFWLAAYGVPLTGSLLTGFYPELRAATEPERLPGPTTYDVLLLGGSVLHPDYGETVAALRDALQAAPEVTGGRPVNLVNLGMPAHSSRDSLLKYRELTAHYLDPEARYDRVIVYQGINEVRANNCPAAVFRADYSHYGWYWQIGLLERHRWMRVVALPITLVHGWLRLREAFGSVDGVPRHTPKSAWLAEGAELKTPPVFEANLTAIVDLAAARGEPLMLMSFAYWLPPDYSREAYLAGTLNYAGGGAPAELWGLPANVAACLSAHNAAVRAVAATHPSATLVDALAAIPVGAANFQDICHLTPAGSRLWAAAVVAGLQGDAGARAGVPLEAPAEYPETNDED